MFRKTNTKKIFAIACSTLMTVSLASCSKSPIDMSDVVFEDATETYDGTAKTLVVENLPSMLTYSFTIADSNGNAVEAGNVINVGSYVFTANFESKSTKYTIPDSLKATLTIEKATYDMSAFTFTGLEVTYDGDSHVPSVSGVPQGVTSDLKLYGLDSSEEIESAIDCGVYKVVASFNGNSNYNEISDREAFMVIRQADYDDSGIEISGLSHVYDGQPHLPTVSGLPSGVTASFKIYKDGSDSAIASAVDAGTYHIVVSFEGDDNHKSITSRTVDMIIGKATYDMSGLTVDNLNVNYDGNAHVPTLSGVPAGVTSSFKFYKGTETTALESATEVGTYKVVISFVGDDNHTAIADVEKTLVIGKGVYDMSNFAWEGLEIKYDGKNHKPTVSGLPSGVTASVKVFDTDNNELTDGASSLGEYTVIASFSGSDNYNDLADRSTKMVISKGDYDMSNFKISGLSHDYTGNSYTPEVSGLPEGVKASIKLYKNGEGEALDAASDAGTYKVVVSFEGDSNHEAIADREDTMVIAKTSKTLSVKAMPRIFNKATENKLPAIVGDLEGAKAIYSFKDSEGNAVEKIDEAGVGTYDVTITFEDDNYTITNILKTTLEITNKTVKNIATYADLVAMAAEAQQNFSLLEADGINELTGEIENWVDYNGGVVEDRWAEQVTYQLVDDIQCVGTWKAAGWDIGHYMLIEQTEIDGDTVSVIKGTQKVVNVPRADGGDSYGFGYVSLYLDGNGHEIKNLKLATDTHENTFGNELGQYPTFLKDMSSDYRRTGMFVSTAFSTFKNIVFDKPTMDVTDTSGTVTWAGFINATESQGNTYEGLKFVSPSINAMVKKANIGGIAGITLVLARGLETEGVRGADYYLDRPEEMIINFKDIEMTDIDFNVNTPTGGRNSVGGLYGENQSGWLTFNLDNVDIDGQITLESTGTANNAADFFGFISAAYMSKGIFVKDPDPFFTFNVSNCDTDITYTLPTSFNFGTGIEGDSYHQVELTEETYEANKYYYLPTKSGTMTLATGAFDATEYYFEKGEGKEILDTNLFYIGKLDTDLVGLMNDKITITNSTSKSGIDVSALKAAITFEGATVEYDGGAHSLVATGLPAGVTVTYSGNEQTEAGEHTVTAFFTYKSGVRTLATWSMTAVLKITPAQKSAKSLLSFENTTLTYNGTYQELTLGSTPSWVEAEYVNNVRKEPGTQTAYAVVENVGNPNYEFTSNVLKAIFTINPYVYDVDADDDSLIAVATEDKIELTVKELGTNGTADVVYFRSYEYFVIDELSGVSTNRTDGTVIPGILYACGTTQKIVFDRFLASGYDMIYSKFSLRIGSEGSYQLLHREVYCKSIASKNGYSVGLRQTVKAVDYPPVDDGAPGAKDAVSLKSNFVLYNILLKDMIYPNEYVDDDGNVVNNIPNIDMNYATPFVSNGTTYYIKNNMKNSKGNTAGYFSDNFDGYIDNCFKVCQANNVNMIGVFYNWNEINQSENPYFATYPDARDAGSMAQFALNSSNQYGEGYIIACIEFLMNRYSSLDTHHNFKNFILGNELELCQRWYPIQDYKNSNLYSARKFSAEYIRTLRIANNAVKKYVADGNVFAPFSRYMSNSSISKDFVYTIKTLLEEIAYISKLEGDFDWGVTYHPYDHSHPNDIVYSSLTHIEFDATLDTQGLTYTNAEVMDRFIKQEQFLYNGEILRKTILCESGISNVLKSGFNEGDLLASAAFAYYRCACLDSVFALCLSDYQKYTMKDSVRALWTEIDGVNTFTLTDGLFNNFTIFDRETKVRSTPEDLGITTWVEMMDIWNDTEVDWASLWNVYKIIADEDVDWESVLGQFVTIEIVQEP